CVRIGALPVIVWPPTNLKSKAGLVKLAFIARDCQARISLTTSAYYHSYGQFIPTGKILPRLKGGTVPPEFDWVTTDDVDAQASDGFPGQPNPLLFLQYTSGSPTEPKGVMVSHETVIHNP